MKYEERIVIGTGEFIQVFLLLKDHFFVEFKRGTPFERIEGVLEERSLSPVQLPQPIDEAVREDEKKVTRKTMKRWVEAVPDTDAKTLLGIENVRRVAPVYLMEGRDISSAVSPLPDVLVIKLTPDMADETIKVLAEKYGVYEVVLARPKPGVFRYFRVGKEGELDKTSYELIHEVQGLRGVEYVGFNWVSMFPDVFIPNDPNWANQWDMERICCVGGWDLETGKSSIVIAVPDSGQDLGHSDIVYSPQADHFNGDEFLDGDLPPYDASEVRAHGTRVAGIAAATINNNLGVAGVAGGCTIMPMYHGDESAGEAASIDWAVAHGAKVINMSSTFVNTADLQQAVEDAHAAGVVLVAAAGNYNNASIIYPAKYPEVIAVGASDQNDERKRPASPDGENWGSCWGNELDVVAPGVLIWTTDIDNGYFSQFNGTSSASPHVAGLAALLLSEYSYLSNTQVRTIIERTCKKASPNTYAYAQVPDRPNGSWVDEMGYGLINIQAALRYASCYGWWCRCRCLVPIVRDEMRDSIIGKEHWEEWIRVRWPYKVSRNRVYVMAIAIIVSFVIGAISLYFSLTP